MFLCSTQQKICVKDGINTSAKLHRILSVLICLSKDSK